MPLQVWDLLISDQTLVTSEASIYMTAQVCFYQLSLIYVLAAAVQSIILMKMTKKLPRSWRIHKVHV